MSQVGSGGKTFYVFAGDTLLGDINGSGTVQRAYTWGAAGLVSERLAPSSTSRWYHFGPQGETRQLTNASGNVADTYVYSAYGQPTASTGTDANPFRYGGKWGYYTDAASLGGAVLCTYRWYDPNTARWLSRDPIGYQGGDNLYAYCLSNPICWSDPMGLEAAFSGDYGSGDINKIKGIISDIWEKGGPIGKDLVDKLRAPGTIYIFHPVNDPHNPREIGRPSALGHDIWFNPYQWIKINVVLHGQKKEVEGKPWRVLGHELGHAVYGYPEFVLNFAYWYGFGDPLVMYNIPLVHNPIAAAHSTGWVGAPRCDHWGGDSVERGK